MATPTILIPTIPPTPSATCSLPMTRQRMTGFLRQYMMQHFSEPSQVEQPLFRDYVWKPTPDTGILIESVATWKPKQTETRPAIVIKSHAWRPQVMGIANRMEGSRALDGFERYTCLMGGTHTLFCIAGEEEEAELLGYEVFTELIAQSDPIRASLGLARFRVGELGESIILEESTQNFAVPVTVYYHHLNEWVVRPHVPVLQRFTIEAVEAMWRG